MGRKNYIFGFRRYFVVPFSSGKKPISCGNLLYAVQVSASGAANLLKNRPDLDLAEVSPCHPSWEGYRLITLVIRRLGEKRMHVFL